METHVRDVSIKLQIRVINLHIIPYFIGRCVIWIDITDMNVNLQMRMVKIFIARVRILFNHKCPVFGHLYIHKCPLTYIIAPLHI